MRGELTWMWVLPGEALTKEAPLAIKATLRRDGSGGTESVWLGKRLVSRTPIGAKGDRGHGLTVKDLEESPYRANANEPRVVFDAANGTCDLVCGDQKIDPIRAPGSWRDRHRGRVPLFAATSILVGLLVLLTRERTEAMPAPPAEDPAAADSADMVKTGSIPTAPVVGRRKGWWRAPQAGPTVRMSRQGVRPVGASPMMMSTPPPPPPPPPPPLMVVKIDVVCDAQGACQGVRPSKRSTKRGR